MKNSFLCPMTYPGIPLGGYRANIKKEFVMAQYDRTDRPDEENNSFYVDEFGEQMRDDETLPERGESLDEETVSAEDSLEQDNTSLPSDEALATDTSAFYEQAPGTTLGDSYSNMPSDDEIGYSPAAEDDDYDPLRFRADEDEAV
jgi:hypothetical protein